MENKRKYVASALFFVITLAITVYVIIAELDFEFLKNVLKECNKVYILVGMSMLLLYLLFQALYTKIILKSLKSKISIARGFVYSCIEFYFSAVTPSSTGGQPVEMYYMKKDGIPMSSSSIAVLLITGIFKLVLIIFGVLVIIFKPWIISGNGILFNVIFTFGFVVNAALIVLCLMLMLSREFIRKIVMGTIRLLAKLRLNKHPTETMSKFEKHLEDYALGIMHIKKNIPMVIATTILTVFQRVALFSVAYFVHLALGMETFTYWDFLALQVAIALAIDSLPLPGGVGASEAMLILLYKKVYPEEIVMPAMILTRTISYYLCFAFTGILTLINHVRTKNITEANKQYIDNN